MDFLQQKIEIIANKITAIGNKKKLETAIVLL
jgi:hypothetical protein